MRPLRPSPTLRVCGVCATAGWRACEEAANWSRHGRLDHHRRGSREGNIGPLISPIETRGMPTSSAVISVPAPHLGVAGWPSVLCVARFPFLFWCKLFDWRGER
uniref:Uncharacterized protein n=1 Tax=Setaria italica TaxID=4555 RepID=K3YWZ8_SETIT